MTEPSGKTGSHDLPGLPTSSDSILKYRYDDNWATCNRAAEKLTVETCDHWREEVEKLLIFAGLFSAIVTAFCIEAVNAVQGDPADKTSLLLQTIVLQLYNISNPQDNFPIDLAPEASVSSSTQRVNLFYALSLTLSLNAVVIGILCLQWLREFGRDVTGVSHRDDLILQYQRNESLKRWGVVAILNALPLLLLISLMLFFVGFLEILWDSQSIAAIPVTVLVALVAIFILVTSILPTVQILGLNVPLVDKVNQSLCPYRSPQAWVFFSIVWPFLALFPCLKSLSNVKTWADYDSRWNRDWTADYIFPSLLWVGKACRQDPRIVSAVYSSLLSPIRDAFKGVLHNQPSHIDTQCWMGYNRFAKKHFRNFDMESSFPADDARLRTFVALYWDKDKDDNHIIDIDLRNIVNLLLPRNIRAGIPTDTAIAYLEVVQDLARRRIFDEHILTVAKSVITGAWISTHHHTHEVAKTFVKTFNDTLKIIRDEAASIQKSQESPMTASPPNDPTQYIYVSTSNDKIVDMLNRFYSQPFSSDSTRSMSTDLQLEIFSIFYRGMDSNTDIPMIDEYLKSVSTPFQGNISADAAIKFFGVVQDMAERHIVNQRVLDIALSIIIQLDNGGLALGRGLFISITDALKTLRYEAKSLRDSDMDGTSAQKTLLLATLETFHTHALDSLSRNAEFLEMILTMIVSFCERPHSTRDPIEQEIIHDLVPLAINSSLIPTETSITILRTVQDLAKAHDINTRLLDVVVSVLPSLASTKHYLHKTLLENYQKTFDSLLGEIDYIQRQGSSSPTHTKSLEAIDWFSIKALMVFGRMSVAEDTLHVVREFRRKVMKSTATMNASWRSFYDENVLG